MTRRRAAPSRVIPLGGPARSAGGVVMTRRRAAPSRVSAPRATKWPLRGQGGRRAAPWGLS